MRGAIFKITMETNNRVISQSYKLHLEKSKWDREAASRVCCLQLSSQLLGKLSSLWQALPHTKSTPWVFLNSVTEVPGGAQERGKNTKEQEPVTFLPEDPDHYRGKTIRMDGASRRAEAKTTQGSFSFFVAVWKTAGPIVATDWVSTVKPSLHCDGRPWILLKHQRDNKPLCKQGKESREPSRKNGPGALLLGGLLDPTGSNAANPELGMRKTPHHVGETLVKATSTHW